MRRKIKTATKTGVFVALVWACMAIHALKPKKNKKTS